MQRSRGLVALACIALVTLLAAMGCRESHNNARLGDDPAPGDARRTSRSKTDDRARAALARLSLEEKIGQLMWPYVYGSHARTRSGADRRANRALYGVATGAEMISTYHVGGLIYLDHNNLDPERPQQSTHNLDDPLQTATLTRGLQAAARKDTGVGLLVATDHEGGSILRLRAPATQWPSAAEVGRADDARLAFAAARAAGRELRAIGINVNFAPVADVNVERNNPVIGDRSFGSNPKLVARMVRAQVRGYAAAGVAATAKHWPGHGDTTVDSHVGLPVVDHSVARWKALDRPPFAAAISAGVPLIMTGHISMPALDGSGRTSSLSKKIIEDLLRDGLNFDGVVVTDSLWMAGVRAGRSDAQVAVQALAAGADILLMPPDLREAITAVRAAVRSGMLPRERLNEAVLRVLRLKQDLGILAAPDLDIGAVERIVGRAAHRAVAEKILEAAGARSRT